VGDTVNTISIAPTYKKAPDSILEPGHIYVFSEREAHQVFQLVNQQQPGQARLDEAKLEWFYKPYKGEDLNGKSLLLWRTGGAGDLLCLTAAADALKKKFPDVHITVSCAARYTGVLLECPAFDVVRNGPVDVRWLENADYHMYFEGLIEQNVERSETHPIDLFAEKLFVEPGLPQASCSKEELKAIRKLFCEHHFNSDRPVVAIQLWTAVPIRRYPPENLVEVAKSLADKGCNIVWLGSHAESGYIQKNGIDEPQLGAVAINLPAIYHDWGHTIAAIAASDLVISSDSSSLHIAGAYTDIKKLNKKRQIRFTSNTPGIGLFGPFRASARLSKYPKMLGIEAQGPCFGCSQHTDVPCALSFPSAVSPCLDLIKPELITKTAIAFLEDCYAGKLKLTERANIKDTLKPILASHSQPTHEWQSRDAILMVHVS